MSDWPLADEVRLPARGFTTDGLTSQGVVRRAMDGGPLAAHFICRFPFEMQALAFTRSHHRQDFRRSGTLRLLLLFACREFSCQGLFSPSRPTY
jgi:hypothetical protein